MMNAILLKVGGSLALQPKSLQELCTKLSDYSKEKQLVVVPGGGEFADTVRSINQRFNLSDKIAHRMAILGMDQYGLLLFNLMPNSLPINDIAKIWDVLDSRKLAVFLPSSFMEKEDPLENSWNVTSDAIAVYLAGRLSIKKVLLVTDVDGIYKGNPKEYSEEKLIKKIYSKELSELNERTSVDMFTPKLIGRFHVDCYVVNGLFPERVLSLIEGKDTISTRII